MKGPIPPGQGLYEFILDQAVGFGGGVTGGQGFSLATVTNTNNSGAGSLREAIDAGGNKWIRFTKDLAGTITLSSQISVDSNNVTVDGRGANIEIANSGSPARAINVTADNTVFLYLKFDSSNSPNRDALVAQNSVDGLWIHHCTFTGTGDDQFSFQNAGAVAGVGNCTISWGRFSGAGSAGPILLNGNSGTPAGTPTRVTIHHCDASTGDRFPFHRNCRLHMYNNYMHNYSRGYAIGVNDGQNWFESNYCSGDGAWQQVAKWSQGGEAEPGKLFQENNTLVNGATFGATSTEGSMALDPSTVYSYTPDTADTTMRDDVINNAGWQNVSFPGD